MSTARSTPSAEPIISPDSDGEPIAENTLQFDWIMKIKGGIDALFKDNPEVFVTDEEHRRADEAAARAHAAEQQAQAERQRAEALMAKLRSMGIDSDA